MARKVYCKNTGCKHHKSGDCCDTTVKIGSSGRCGSFEKGFVYYFHLVWDALGSANYIDAMKLNDDLRIGIYYVMSVYHLGFSEMEWGNCRMIMLKDAESAPGLKYEDIIAREMDEEVFYKLHREFNEGNFPRVQKEKVKKDAQPYGWLSPTGLFIESPFGTHEESAEIICEEKGLMDEYKEWRSQVLGRRSTHLVRDFLTEAKGYCLIHDPSGCNGYIVSNVKPLTKKQKEFLYGYFIDIGDRFKAERYLE